VSGADEDFGTVLGNVVFLGNDHDSADAHGSAIYPHQQAPDTTPPAVTFVSPTPGATNQKTTSRVGVLFSDNVDIRVAQHHDLHRAPHGRRRAARPLHADVPHGQLRAERAAQAGTTYEVVINGVKDWAGNTMTAAFVSSFTTAGSGGPAPANCNLGADSVSYVGRTSPSRRRLHGRRPLLLLRLRRRHAAHGVQREQHRLPHYAFPSTTR
jgi:hypothetical protein